MGSATMRFLRKHGQKFFAVSLRLMAVLQLVTGLGFIGFACYLQFPPSDSLTLGLIVIGALAAATAIFACVLSCAKGCGLTVYLTLATIVTLAQSGFALYLFIAPQNAVDKLLEHKSGEGNEEKFHTAVYTGRWVFLGLMAVQLLAMLFAVIFRAINKEDYEKFEAEEYEQRKTQAEQQLEQLKEKIKGVEAANSVSPSKSAVHLAATAVAPTAAEQRRSLFGSDSEDAKLDLESGTIPAMPAASVRGAWPAEPQPAAPAWAAAQQPQPGFKPSWSKASSKTLL